MNVYDCLHMFTVYENSYSIFLAEPFNHERRHHDVTKRYGWYEGIDLMNHPNMTWLVIWNSFSHILGIIIPTD